MAAEMERWRSFFAQAEADLWTIIEKAILVAAADFPAEFRHKRCEIAEILFERRPCRSPPTRSMDVTMASGSIVTNATCDAGEKASHHIGREDDGIRQSHTSRFDIKIADTQSQDTAPPRFSAVERPLKNNDEQGACFMSHNKPNALSVAARGPDSDLTVLQKVNMIKDQIIGHTKIIGHTNESDDGILRSLHALERLDITVEILKATDIGREVNKFRKHLSAPVQNLAKQLVRTWKGMVDEWVKKSETQHPSSASEEEEAANRASLQKESLAQKSLQLSKQPSSNPNLDLTITARSHSHIEHAVEDMGSSRVESDVIYRHGSMERKVNLSGQQVHIDQLVAPKSLTGSEGLGRPLNTTFESERHRVFPSNKLAFENKKQEEDCRILAESSLAVDQKRPDVLKRRMLEGQLEECAKKQRYAPPSSYPEFCKKSAPSTRLPSSARAQHLTQRR